MRISICTAVFLLMTAVKMLSPALAAEIKDRMLPILDSDTDYQRVLHQLERKLRPGNPEGEFSYTAEPPQMQLRRTLDSLHRDPLAELPKADRIVIAPPESTPAPDPALEYGYAVREAFLQTQSGITSEDPPENVSYDISPLPFSETSPVAGFTSSGFGYRTHPIQGELLFHYGTDFAADAGTEIRAFADGTILAVGEDEGYGNYVMIDHGSGYVTLYGHCSKLLISEGETVSKGQIIALVGASGKATGPHLHFELMHDGIYLNPEFYLFA